MPEGLLGSAGFPDGFIALGLLAVLPTVPELPVAEPGEVPTVEPTDGEVPVDVVPADVPVPVPLAPAVPPPLACANATVLDSASAPANAKVVIFMVVSLG